MTKTWRLLTVGGMLTATTFLSACNPIEEKPCSAGSYPVKYADGSPGGDCVKSRDPVPSDMTTYPSGQTPTKAEDL